MVDKPQPTDGTPPAAVPTAPRRGPGHRGADMRDTVAEMAERAQLISQEAGSKVAAAMKDVISAAAGIAGFAIESARDLVQYMVKRGQMTPEEAEKLIREAEAAHEKRPATEKARPTATKVAAERAAVAKAEAAARAAAQAAIAPPFRPAVRPPIAPPVVAPARPAVAAKPAPKEPARESAKPTPKHADERAKPAAKPAAKTVKTSKPAKASKPAAKGKGRKH